jgi:hypothetical protein
MGTGSQGLVTLAYRWLDAGGRTIAQRDDAGRLPWDLGAGETVSARVVLHPPGAPGAVRLVVGTAQDDDWFDGTASACFGPHTGRQPCAADVP